MSPVQQIALIDKRIDGIRLELFRRGLRSRAAVRELVEFGLADARLLLTKSEAA